MKGITRFVPIKQYPEKKPANCRKAVVFLTPCGGKPETAHENPQVPVLALSWEKVAEFLKYILSDSE